MGNGMPFVLEKGPVWEYFDRAYSPGGARGDTAGRLDVLNGFRHRTSEEPKETWTDIFIRATTKGTHPTVKQKLREHIVDDWFTGRGTPGSGGWLNWTTNPAEVVVRGLARAYEISLGIANHVELPGLDDESAPPATPKEATRLWPIEFYWACPLPVFQCWIAWRPVPSGASKNYDGLVTFTWATPAPAWSYLAQRPADDGRWFDDENDPQFGPLGRADFPDGSRKELDERNLDSAGLLLIGEDNTEVLCDGVDLSGKTEMIQPVPCNGPEVNSQEEFMQICELRMQGNQNEFALRLPILAGSQNVVTVSPFDDVGGYNETRNAQAGGRS